MPIMKTVCSCQQASCEYIPIDSERMKYVVRNAISGIGDLSIFLIFLLSNYIYSLCSFNLDLYVSAFRKAAHFTVINDGYTSHEAAMVVNRSAYLCICCRF